MGEPKDRAGKYRDGGRGFKPGNPGRPKGARHKTTMAVEALLQGQAEELTQAAIQRALEGDGVALRLCLERIAPARKEPTVRFTLPPIESAQDLPSAVAAIIAATSKGELSPGEAGGVVGLLDRYRQAIETNELAARIAALEERT